MKKENRTSKKAVANIIVIILLILLAISSLVILSRITQLLIREQLTENIEPTFNCIKDVDIEILNACYTNNLLKIKIKNNKDILLGNFFLINFNYLDGTSETIPTPPMTYIDSYQTKTILMNYENEIEKIIIVPKIENQVFLCYEFAPEYKNIGEC